MSNERSVRGACWLVWAAAALVGCAHGGGGELDVDAVQARANEIEGHLRQMRQALDREEVDEAAEKLEAARETLAEHREALTAYPEEEELVAAVERAGGTLCYRRVGLRLKAFFAAVRAEDIELARERLQRARSVHAACRERIAGRQDYMPLKMNLDSAPQVIVELERKLARPALLERIARAKAPLEKRRREIARQLAELDENPKQRELAVALDAGLKALERDLADQPDFGGDPAWTGFAASLAGELDAWQQRRAELVRRGKLLTLVEDELPAVDAALQKARGRKDTAVVRRLLREARERLRTSRKVLAGLLAEERELARFRFNYRRRQRNGAWLRRHLARRLRIVERTLQRLDRPRTKSKKRRRRSGRRRIKRW
jgi:hypothetical protein